MLIPLSPAASTCGCRCSAPPRGSVRWRARWRRAGRWSGSSRPRSWWRALWRVLVADAARWWWPWPHCCSWPSRPAPSPPSGRTGSSTTPWPTSPPTVPPSPRSVRSPPTRTSSPVARSRSPDHRWSGGSPCVRSPAGVARSTWSLRCSSWAMPTTLGCRSARRCGCTVGCCRLWTVTSPHCSGRAARPRSSSRPARGGVRPARSARPSATRWRTDPPTSGPWCPRWSTATTPRSTRASRTRSARPG